LSLKSIKKVIKEVSTIGVNKLIISGGEPTLFLKKIVSVIRYAKQNNIRQVVLSTNCSYAANLKETYKITSMFKNAGLNHIQFSFDTDHIKCIPLDNFVNAIIASVEENLKVSIRVIDKSNTKKRNTIYLEQLAKNVNGKVSRFIPKITKLLLHDTSFTFLRVDGNLILIRRDKMAYRGRATQLTKEFIFKKPEKLLFDKCAPHIYSHIAVDWKGYLWPCCNLVNSFSKDVNLGDIKNFDISKILKKLKKIYEFVSLLGFIKFYLYLKNKKNLKNILDQKYADRSHFCSLALKYIPKTPKELEEYKTTKVSTFLLKNTHHLLKYYINFFLSLLVDKTLKMYQDILLKF